MDHRFPTNHSARRTRTVFPVAGTTIAVGLFLFTDHFEGPLEAAGFACLLAGIGVLVLFRKGMVGPELSARDHLRLGERRWLFIIGYAGVVAMIGVLAFNAVVQDKPLWTYVAVTPWFGVGALAGWFAMTRLIRDPARRNCPGAYGDCRDCDTFMPVLELREVLGRVNDDALDHWEIDPVTGAEVKVGTRRDTVTTHTLDDAGHEVARMYLLADVPGTHVPRLVPVTAYDDGVQDIPNLSDPSELERRSMDAEGVNAIHRQVARTLR
jgi:hypothetical protein